MRENFRLSIQKNDKIWTRSRKNLMEPNMKILVNLNIYIM